MIIYTSKVISNFARHFAVAKRVLVGLRIAVFDCNKREPNRWDDCYRTKLVLYLFKSIDLHIGYWFDPEYCEVAMHSSLL